MPRLLERLRVGPEPFLEEDDAVLDPESRPVERRLRVEAIVDQRGDELHVRLRLDEAAHHAERAEELSVPEQHAGDDRVVRTLARLDAPLDGEAAAAVLEQDAGARSDEPGAEAPVQALDERDGRPVAVDRAQVDGAAPERRRRARD